MFWKSVLVKSLFAALSAAAVLAPLPACAQIGGADLPDLSGLAGAIEKSARTMPKPASGSVFASGLPVPSVRPGEGAKSFVRQLRQAMEKNGVPNPAMRKLEDAMPATLAGFETYLVKHGLAKRDLGNALGVFFVENWKTATRKSLSDTGEVSAIRSVSAAAAGKYKARFAAMTPAGKEKTYETLIASTIVLNQFAEAFDKIGKSSDAASMRRAAGTLFTKVVGTPPSGVKIAADGRISGAASAGTASSPPVPHSASASLPPARPGAGVSESQIAGIYCQPAYGSGAGGGVSVSYEPVLALKDGTYCGGFERPPSELDVAASRRSHPGQWGRWRRSGASIETQKHGSGWEKSGWIGPLPPSGPGQTLSGRYTSVSGGGNSALGGGITIGIEDSFTFLPGGRFVSGHTNSVSSAGVAGGASRSASGTYAISRNAIILRYAGGTVKRWSYAKTKDGLVFLHGTAYVDDK